MTREVTKLHISKQVWLQVVLVVFHEFWRN